MEQCPHVDLHSLMDQNVLITQQQIYENTTELNCITMVEMSRRVIERSIPLPQVLIVSQVLPDTAGQAQVSGIQVRQDGNTKFRWEHLQIYKTMLLFT